MKKVFLTCIINQSNIIANRIKTLQNNAGEEIGTSSLNQFIPGKTC